MIYVSIAEYIFERNVFNQLQTEQIELPCKLHRDWMFEVSIDDANEVLFDG